MKPYTKSFSIVLLLAVSLTATGCGALRRNHNVLKASGLIETTEISVSSETGGLVLDVTADEGDLVKADTVLLKLDDSLLASQRSVAAAQFELAAAGAQIADNALATADSQYQMVLQAALEQDKNTRLRDWFTQDPYQFDQPGWYFTRTELIEAAQTKADLAKVDLENSQTDLAEINESLEAADFIEAEQRLLNARLEYIISKEVNQRAKNSVTEDIPSGFYNLTHCGTNAGYFVQNARLTNQLYGCSGDAYLSNASQTLYDQARQELEAAQKAYNDILSTDNAEMVLQKRAKVSVAQERYYSALDFMRELQLGEQSSSVAAAEGILKQAQSAADQAHKAVDQAQAQLDLIDTQIAKLTVTAPIDGVVLTHSIERGEILQPGMTAMTLGKTDDLTVTVYIAEDRYGQIGLGDAAMLTVDSFPGETFEAVVTRIADQAEYTPRNVQTKEERQTTVYAIELKVTDSQGRLKPGMPADVEFLIK
ncbi:MAG: efflux RND transporter periplasmic adaptor subunit [Anaerolineales bacterium]|nr:efflux RND transporter periplasmic adaptor subunit [Anaerolineales bacterium]